MLSHLVVRLKLSYYTAQIENFHINFELFDILLYMRRKISAVVENEILFKATQKNKENVYIYFWGN